MKYFKGKKSWILLTSLIILSSFLHFFIGHGTAFILIAFFTLLTAGHIGIKCLNKKYNNKYTKPLKIMSWSLLLGIGMTSVFILIRVSLPQFGCQNIPKELEIEYMIILGSGLKNGNELSPMLKARLDKGLEVLESYPELTVIVSGGQGSDEELSEAQAMANYMINHGISEKQIILENQSHSTRENLFYSEQKIGKIGSQSVLILSSDFHLFRAQMIARDFDLNPIGICSKTNWLLKSNYMIREIPAVVNDWWR